MTPREHEDRQLKRVYFLMSQIHEVFGKGAKLTLIVNYPLQPDADVCMSEQSLEDIERVLQRAKERRKRQALNGSIIMPDYRDPHAGG